MQLDSANSPGAKVVTYVFLVIMLVIMVRMSTVSQTIPQLFFKLIYTYFSNCTLLRTAIPQWERELGTDRVIVTSLSLLIFEIFILNVVMLCSTTV